MSVRSLFYLHLYSPANPATGLRASGWPCTFIFTLARPLHGYLKLITMGIKDPGPYQSVEDMGQAISSQQSIALLAGGYRPPREFESILHNFKSSNPLSGCSIPIRPDGGMRSAFRRTSARAGRRFG